MKSELQFLSIEYLRTGSEFRDEASAFLTAGLTA